MGGPVPAVLRSGDRFWYARLAASYLVVELEPFRKRGLSRVFGYVPGLATRGELRVEDFGLAEVGLRLAGLPEFHQRATH